MSAIIARTLGPLRPDQIDFIHGAPPTSLLAAATGKIDLNLAAAEEVASRGYDRAGVWIGFAEARDAHLRVRASAVTMHDLASTLRKTLDALRRHFDLACNGTEVRAALDARNVLERFEQQAARAGQSSNPDAWLPIATAPKNGACVLIARYGEEAIEAMWMTSIDGAEAGWYGPGHDPRECTPLRADVWQPKPVAPTAPQPQG